MSKIEHKATKRKEVGKKQTKLLRKEGMIPAALYGNKKNTEHLAFDKIEMLKDINSGGFLSRIITLVIGTTKQLALVKDIQFHPVKDEVLHIDFLRLDKNSEIEVNIPLKLTGKENSKGLKRGGILNLVHPVIKLICKVNSIVENIEIDITDLGLGGTIKIKDINLPKGVTQKAYDENETILNINAPKGSSSSEEESTEAAAEE